MGVVLPTSPAPCGLLGCCDLRDEGASRAFRAYPSEGSSGARAHTEGARGRCSTTGLSVRTFDATVARLRSMHLIVVVPGLRDGLPGRPKGTYEPGWALELIVPALANVSGRVR